MKYLTATEEDIKEISEQTEQRVSTPTQYRLIIDQICEDFEIELTLGDRNVLARELARR